MTYARRKQTSHCRNDLLTTLVEAQFLMTDLPLLKDGDKIVFLGDSITQTSDGYVSIVEAALAALLPGQSFTCINAGVGGNKVGDMLARIGEDVIAHDPDWITISVGINDVWHGLNGTPIDLFKQIYTELVDRLIKQTVSQVALFTTTVIGEDLESECNRKLIPYNDFIRETAAKRKLLLVPMNEEFHKAITAYQKRNDHIAAASGERIREELRFTTDGVHMKPAGNMLMALTLLRSWQIL